MFSLPFGAVLSFLLFPYTSETAAPLTFQTLTCSSALFPSACLEPCIMKFRQGWLLRSVSLPCSTGDEGWAARPCRERASPMAQTQNWARASLVTSLLFVRSEVPHSAEKGQHVWSDYGGERVEWRIHVIYKMKRAFQKQQVWIVITYICGALSFQKLFPHTLSHLLLPAALGCRPDKD